MKIDESKLESQQEQLNIPVVIHSILNGLLEREKEYTEKEFDRKNYDFYTRQQFSARADELRRAIELVKKYCV
jgi:hypothetical protein